MNHTASSYPRKEPVIESAEYYSVEEQKAVLGQRYDLNTTATDELYRLLKDMLPHNFTHSSQLSSYIIENKLGYKYPNISGIVRMANSKREWNFPGGISPGIYAIICDELELGNKGTEAIPIKFTSFKEMQSRMQKSPLT